MRQLTRTVICVLVLLAVSAHALRKPARLSDNTLEPISPPGFRHECEAGRLNVAQRVAVDLTVSTNIGSTLVGVPLEQQMKTCLEFGYCWDQERGNPFCFLPHIEIVGIIHSQEKLEANVPDFPVTGEMKNFYTGKIDQHAPPSPSNSSSNASAPSGFLAHPLDDDDQESPGEDRPFTLSCPDCNGTDLPRYSIMSCQGEKGTKGLSPSLRWENLPPDTKSLILLMEDTEATSRPWFWIHWLVVDIPAAQGGLPKGASNNAALLPSAAFELNNSDGEKGYLTPCTRMGEMKLTLTLFARSTPTYDRDVWDGQGCFKTKKQFCDSQEIHSMLTLDDETLGSTKLEVFVDAL